MRRIAIFHPSDPLGHIPSGIDAIIRGVLKWAPPELEYTLFGGTSDEQARPVGSEVALPLGNRSRFVPLVSIDARGRRARVPLTVRYMLTLQSMIWHGRCAMFDALDFHRVDLAWLFRGDPRPRSIVIHQDMSILRNENCDIMWRHAPGLYERLERSVLRHAQHVFTVRRSAVERYGKTYPDLATRISFLPTWFDSSVFHPPQDEQERTGARALLRQELGLPAASRLLVSVGRLDKQKDPLLMLQAFREVLGSAPDAYLLLVGDGVLRAQIEEVRQTLGLEDRVRLLGVMSPERIAEVLAASDLFVMSSAYEGMPIAVLEALASGLPVVSTDVGEVSLVVQNGVNGRISADRKPRSLAAAINDGLAEAQEIRGAQCSRSVEPYRPESILRFIYENHLAQAA